MSADFEFVSMGDVMGVHNKSDKDIWLHRPEYNEPMRLAPGGWVYLPASMPAEKLLACLGNPKLPPTDITHDVSARLLFRRLARHPWDKFQWQVARDRVLDLGLDWPYGCAACDFENAVDTQSIRRYPRRRRRKILQAIERTMKAQFGDWDKKSETPIPF